MINAEIKKSVIDLDVIQTMFPLLSTTISKPVVYQPYDNTIWDSDDNLICELSGHQKIKLMDDGKLRIDELGELIALLINNI